MPSIRRRSNNEVVQSYASLGPAIAVFEDRYNKRDFYLYNENWRIREATRTNLVDLTPFGLAPITDHFLHISKTDDPTTASLTVTYTESVEKGERDIQVQGRNLGRYLREFYPSVTNDNITELVSKITAHVRKAGVKFAITADEIVDMYRRSNSGSGTYSCMSGDNRWNYLPQNRHPCEAYGNSDLSFAYLERNGNVTARAVIWKAKKLFGRIYGDTAALKQILENLGYSYGSMNGATINAIPFTPRDDSRSNRSYYLAPYVDGAQVLFLSEDKTKFSCHDDGYRLDSDRVYSPGDSGYARFESYICAVTGAQLSSNNAWSIHSPIDGETVYIHLNNRRDPDYVWQSPDRDYSYALVPGMEWIETPTNGRVPLRYAESHMIRCVITGDYYRYGELVEVANEWMCYKAFLEHARRDSLTGRAYRIGDMTQDSIGNWWSVRSRRDNPTLFN